MPSECHYVTLTCDCPQGFADSNSIRIEAIMSDIMTSHHSAEVHEMCNRLKDMGYAQSKHIRIYGQEFVVISNPFPEGNGIAVRVISKRGASEQTLKIPLPVVQSVSRRKAA